jgi:hypothetical protein
MHLGVAEYLEQLYYGDIDGYYGGFMDMSPETQEDLARNGMEQKIRRLTDKSRTIRQFVEYAKANPDALDSGFLHLDEVLQKAHENGD